MSESDRPSLSKMCAARGKSLYLRWRFLAVLFVLAVESSRSIACPKSCACYVPTEVHCTFRYLTAMPSEIQSAVERINLGYNSLTVLKENELSGLTNLELLMLHSNTIHTIEDRAFHNLKALQVLKMSYNRVRELRKETFTGLNNLLRLHMDHNQIEFIHPEALYGLTSLQLVHLEGNLLQQLHPDTFITLRHSQIFKFSSIKTIYLSENLLTTLPPNVFNGCYQLENLFLNGNAWSCDCQMEWIAKWIKKNPGVLKCKRERKLAGEQHCPICEWPFTSRGQNILHLSADAYTCSKPWIQPHLKQRNITMDENGYTQIFPKDFIAPIGTLEMNITDQFHNDASIACVVQRPMGLDNINITQGVKGEYVTTLVATVATSLICNIDYEHIRQLWSLLATYSDLPLKLERELLLAMPPEMIYKYKQASPVDDEIFTGIEVEIKANPAWLMQGIISLQLDRTTTTYSTLNIKYLSSVEMNIETNKVRRDHYGWTMIKRDNQTKTETSVVVGGVAELSCQANGDPKPSIEWILPDGSKVRAPYNSEDRRIIIADNGKLILSSADSSDAGIYHCIATNYLNADVISFRVTVLSIDTEEVDVNGVQLSRSVGDSLFLDCEVTASPQGSVQWILPDNTVMNTSYVNRKLYQNGTLVINKLTERDRGFYRCIAANLFGLDLLVSLITLSSNGPEHVRLDTEASGEDVQPSTETVLYNKDVSTSVSQESRTVTSHRPYPRPTHPLRRVPTNRRGGSRRPGWSRRVFDKTSRKVDPEKIADFIKRSQNNVSKNIVTPSDKLKANEGLSVDDEIGSGNAGFEGHNTIPDEVQTITGRPENNYDSTLYYRPEYNAATITEVVTDDPSSVIIENMSMENMRTATAGLSSYTDTSPLDASITLTNYEIQKDETTPFIGTQGYTVGPSDSISNMPLKPVTLKFTVTETMNEMELQFSGDIPETAIEAMPHVHYQNHNVTSIVDLPEVRRNPVVHTSTDPESQTSFTAVTTTQRAQDEITFHTTQRIKSPRLPPGSTIISRQQIHIIPPNIKRPGKRRNFSNRRRIIRPNKITDIQSILDKFKRPSVRHEGNVTVPYTVELSTDCDHGKRGMCSEKSKPAEEQRIIKPTTMPYVPTSSLRKTEKRITTTLSTPFVTSAMMIPKSNSVTTETQLKSDAPKQKPTQDPIKTVTQKFLFSTPVTSTTTAFKSSKVIRGKIPWDRLFGNKEDQQKILKRLRKPTKTSTVTQNTKPVRIITTTASLRVIATLPTAKSLVVPVTASPSVTQRNQDNLEISSDDLSGSSSITEAQTSYQIKTYFSSASPSNSYFKTSVPYTPVTTPTYASRLLTTVSQVTPILPVPPTSRTAFKEDTVESGFSGSETGGSGRFPGRSWRNRKSGFHRRRFRGKRPTKQTTTKVPMTKTTTYETTNAPHTISRVFRPLYTPAGAAGQFSVVTSHGVTDLESEAWRKLSKTTAFPKSFSTVSESIATYRTTNTVKPHTTPSTQHRKNTNMKPSSRRGGIYDTPWRGKPKVTDSRHRDRLQQPKTTTSSFRDKKISKERAGGGSSPPHTVTVLTAEESYSSTSVPNNNGITSGISKTYDQTTWYDTTPANTIGFVSSTTDMTSKPRIVGGNAASFTVLSESDAFLPCEATGNPEPVIIWKRFSSSTGSTLTIKGNMGKFEVFRNGTLLIQNTNIKDRGQYLCLAENDYGSDKLLVMLSVVAYPSRILEPAARDIKVYSGKTVEIKCKAEGRPVPVVSWILANRTQVRGQINERGRVTVTPNGTLVIQQVSVYDRGHYKCIASNSAGADTVTVRLQVVAAPPGILEEKRQLVRANAGQVMWLPCTAQGEPQPTTHWVLFGGTVVRPLHTDSKVSVFPNGTLHMRNLVVSDSGKYECIATSSTGSERRVVTLSVEKIETAPQIVETSDQRTVLEYGGRLHLNCSSTGNPKPRIVWRLPSKALVDQWHRMGKRIQVLENGTLIINSVSEKDAGDYLCVARSKVGDDLQLMKVSVSMKPAKIEPKVVGKKQVPYGKDLKVDCKASGAPVPEISWGLPDGTLVNSALQADSSRGGRSKRYILFDNGTLYLNEVGKDEEGDYTCYAENTLGKDEMHVHITVVSAPPRIHPPSHTYAKVKPGVNIRFDCEAMGEPKPKILWMLPSNDVIAASNERYLMHVNGSLDIRDVKLADAGEYVCMARNSAGDESKVYKLDIDGNPPVINGHYQNRTVLKDTAAKYSRKLIDCKVQGDPPPKITWIMPDNIFLSAPYFGSRINVHYNGTLEIRNVRPTDTAEFICVARNDGGEAVMVVQLEVTSQLMRPIFKNPFNERLVTRLGKTTVLNCSADGQPPPDIFWTLPNGTQFTRSSNRGGSQHQMGNDGTFVIYNPSKEDTGKYRCAAKNKVGYIEKLIVLEVGQKPYILTRPRGIIRSVSGETLFLHCLADGSPRPSIFWTIPGGHVLSRPQSTGRYQLMDNGTLVIQQVNLHDRGNYLCRAKNAVGEAILTVPVVIIAFPPRITNGAPPAVKTITGTPVQLNCIAIGIPKPEITWELPDRSVLSTAGKGRSAGSELLHPQGTLIIQKPTRADSGPYKCLATNHLGTDSRVTYMRVI